MSFTKFEGYGPFTGFYKGDMSKLIQAIENHWS